MSNCYIFDIDGTLADLTHRLHHIQKQPKDWDAFFAACSHDKCIDHIYYLLRDIEEAGAEIVFVSGRPERTRAATKEWLWAHCAQWSPALYMRGDTDRRDDVLVKQDLLKQLRKDGYYPLMAFDDRDRVVKMWRENGIPCAQVAPGDF